MDMHDIVRAHQRLTRGDLGVGLMACVAMLLQAHGYLNLDVSWFISFAEAILDGARAYIDIADPNLPMAAFIYMPAVVVARLIGSAVEPVAVGLLVGVTLLMCHSWRWLREGGCVSGLMVGFVLLVLPALCFAEREHIIALALIGWLSLLIERLRGGDVSAIRGFAIGVGLAVALAIKPIYGLCIICPLALCFRTPAVVWRAMLPEVFGMLCGAGLYVLCAWPDLVAYVQNVAPVVRDVYAFHGGSVHVFEQFGFRLMIAAGLCIALCVGVVVRGALAQAIYIWLAAALAAAVIYVAQGKYWDNHLLPAMMLVAMAGVFFLSHPTTQQRSMRLKLWCYGLFALWLMNAPFIFNFVSLVNNWDYDTAVYAMMRAYAPPQPRLVVLAFGMALGHPIIRQIGGRFVGHDNSLWVGNSLVAAQKSVKIDQDLTPESVSMMRRELSMNVAMIDAHKANMVIVVPQDISRIDGADQLVTASLVNFHRAAVVDGVELWVRNQD